MKYDFKKTVLLVIISITISFSFTIETAYSDGYGVALGSFNGVIAYSNGNTGTYLINNQTYINATYIGVQWQCVEYVRRYYYQIYGVDLASAWRGNADTWYDNAAIMNLDRYQNKITTIRPQVGDILVSESCHIAIVRSVSDTEVCTIQQNWTNTSGDLNLCRTLSRNSFGQYSVAGFSSGYPIRGWLRRHNTTDGWVSVSSLNVSPSNVILGQDFNISFVLKETRGAAKTFDWVAVAVLQADGTFIFDAATYPNVTVPANGTWSRTATNYLYNTRPPGTYKVMIRGYIDGQWFDFDYTDNGQNPRNFSVITASSIIPGDLNRDGTVNIYDYGIFHENYGKTGCGNPADINGDCVVNYLDYGILHQNYGR